MKTFRVFLASPSDLDVERNIVEEAVKEINLGSGEAPGLHLELFRWETQSTPGLGSDAQAILNE